MSLELRHRDFTLVLAPDYGGSVLSFRHRERDLLRPAPSRISDDWWTGDFAAFPMVPFCGRIAHGKFETENMSITLRPNMPPEPHAIHGFGWQSSWDAVDVNDTVATLIHSGGGKNWPWPYEARQTFTLSDGGLSLNMSVTNHGDTKMPAGLGWHPYFPRKDASLNAPTTAIWLSGDDMIPAPPQPVTEDVDLTIAQSVDALTLDYAFDLSAAIQTLTWPDLTLRQISDPVFSKMVVYVPPRKRYFCVEPVSHAPDAVNSALPDEVTGMKWLEPGQTLRGSITLLVELSA